MSAKFFMTYVLIYEDKYVKFGSYSSLTLTDSLLCATLYTRYATAKQRLAYPDPFWHKGKEIDMTKLAIFEVTVQLYNELHIP